MEYDRYCIIFDTNILFVTYTTYADFNRFKFNTTFENILRKIESYELEKYVDILIPNVVWNEIIEQNLVSYEEKNEELKNKISKIKVPNITFNETEINYKEFLLKKVEEYRNEIFNKDINIKELNLPKSEKFESIIKRAYNKRPPFEGKGGKSDKGFKDALLWESIIQYRESNNIGMILYTKDKIFNAELKEEFENIFLSDSIDILSDEAKIDKKLNEISKKINGIVINEVSSNATDEQIDRLIGSKEIKSEIVDKLIDTNLFKEEYFIEDIVNIQILDKQFEELEQNKWVYLVKVSILFLIKNMQEEDKIIEKKQNAEFEIDINIDKSFSIDFKLGEIIFKLKGGEIDEIK